MNEQKPPNGIEWTRLPKGDGTFTRGFTWNPIAGCLHGCRWTMPDGDIAECYAKTVAESLASSAYPHGFEHHYFYSDRLEEPLKVKELAGIFICSMADLLGHWVPDEQVLAVLDVCRQASQHTFFLLTKNAPRLEHFTFPPNVWAGVSSPPDYMFGKELSRHQQERILRTSLSIFENADLFGNWITTKWMSFEPLSWNVSDIVCDFPNALDWAVIGGASNGAKKYPPREDDLRALVRVLDEHGTPIFFKGNLRPSMWAQKNWRAEFPQGIGER